MGAKLEIKPFARLPLKLHEINLFLGNLLVSLLPKKTGNHS
jgi:hypothetical protein